MYRGSTPASRHLWRAAVAALGLALMLSGCGQFGPQNKPKEDEKKEKKEEGVPVETAKVGRGNMEAIVRTSTNLEAELSVKVFSRTSNLVKELLVEEGDYVEKDQVLLRLRDTEQQTAFDKAKTLYLKTEEEFKRQKSLYDQNLVSEQIYKDAMFTRDQQKLAMEEAELQLKYTEVRAPIAGTITTRMVNLGDNVTSNQHLFDMVDFDSLVARVYLPERHLPFLRPDQQARVRPTSQGNEMHPAYVKRIAPIVDAKSGLVKVTLAFKDVGTLKPGMYVEAEVVLDTHVNAVVIPKRAVVYDEDQMFVFRMGESNRVERVHLIPQLADREFVEPVSGFSEGDEIVIAGQTGLKEGSLVKLPGEVDEEEAESAKDDKPADEDKKDATKTAG